MEFKYPTTQEEMDELRNSLKSELAEEALDAVVGGNETVQGQGGYISWTCQWCGQTLQLKQMHDAAKHCAHDCPCNPFK